MVRKSPVRHDVGGHYRQGVWVDTYKRGKGRSPQRSKRSKVVGKVPKKKFSSVEARRIGEDLGIDWNTSPFEVDDFRIGLEIELEHGIVDPETDVSRDDPLVTGKIALAHLNEFPDYYKQLVKLERRLEKG